MTDIRLGRLPSPEEERDKYLRRFALTPETAPSKPVFVVFGIDWPQSFFSPVRDKDGHYWVGKGKPRSWGKVAGGHAIMAPPVDAPYDRSLFQVYDQGETPKCVAFSHCFGMSILNGQARNAEMADVVRDLTPTAAEQAMNVRYGVLYQPGWLYNKCQQVYDKIPGPPPPYDGTEVRAADECLRVEGLVRQGENFARPEDGIAAYRWATTIEDIHQARGTDVNIGYIEWWQTWGPGFGEGGRIRIPNESAAWLLGRPYADCVVPTDKG